MTETATAAPDVHVIQGQAVRLPVEIRRAQTWFASYLVPIGPAADLIAYAGLQPATILAGRAMCTVVFVKYLDGDLGPYNEVGVALMIDPPMAGAARRRRRPSLSGRQRRPSLSGPQRRPKPAPFIHRLPVNQAFTLEAGREIWGFPKFMTDSTIVETGRSARCHLSHDGAHVLTITVHRGIGGLTTPESTMDAYSFRDGVLRCTPWLTRNEGVCFRPGGARLELGDHPMAEELRSLGLPKTALMTGTVRRMHASFGLAVIVRGG